MLLQQDSVQKTYIQRVQVIYEKDYTKWLGYGRKRGYSEEAIVDAIQEMSLKALNLYERLSDFDDLQLHAYMMTVFKNILYDIARKRGTMPLEHIACDEVSAEEVVMNQEDYESLNEIVKVLSLQQQQYIYLKYYLCLSNKEIGEQMGIKDNAVRTIKHRTITAFRKLLTVEENEMF